MALDETRQLIFVGDNDRIKSYAWAAPNGERYERTPHPTHTLKCRRESGPITILPNGTIIRAGKGRAAVWNIDSLETHGETGQGIVGKKHESMVEITDRDDPEDIELSTGSSATSHIKFIDNSDLSMARWEPLVQAPSTMICHPDNYQCFTIDLEHGGTITARYLGHGGKVHDLSISGADPQVFLTACSDGFARLFDLRSPLPVLTFDACGQSEFCDAAVLAHPDGIPTIFTGTGKSEQIKVWDVRARTPVYEIATGNNRVQSLAWEPNRHCLYAATECDYQDRHGYRHEYRHSRKWKDEDIDEEDFEIDTPAWPEKAWHDENYFGYAFDAGEHRIYRYAFKEDPDPSIMPEYGDASVNESSRY
ncbi:hypothetical protein FRC08_018857 [Ceratobasidium sp. 394]|nr:hypothetical protein FRC08_018857 [Ceratobasidium sp. 394]